MDKLISDHPNAIIRTYSMRILRTLETDAKKVSWPRNKPIIKIQNFDPIIVKLCHEQVKWLNITLIE